MNFDKLAEYMDSLLQADIPFIDMEVSRNNKIVFRKGVGNPDTSRQLPLKGDEIYAIASCSKIATCLGALKLIEEGIISLDMPLYEFFPEFKKLLVKNGDSIGYAIEPLTVKSLFLMGAGWSYDILKELPKTSNNNISLARELSKRPMEFEPGTDFIYGLSHDVLAGVIEVATGMRLGEYLNNILFIPLKMSDTGFQLSDNQRKRQPVIYNYDSKMNRSTAVDTGFVENMLTCGWEELGGSALYSTVSDYSRLMCMLANGGKTPDNIQLFKEKTISMCTCNMLEEKPLFTARSSVLSYGYGWGLCGRVNMNRKISQSSSADGEFGWNGATGTYALADLKNQVSIFVGMQTLGCFYMIDVVHNKLRDLTYEALSLV